MTPKEARSHYNYLMTLCIRKEEAFGPMAITFIREQDFDQLGLTPEEQFNLYMATADAFAAEPKRYTHKLECLQKAQQVLRRTQFFDPGLSQHIARDMQKTSTELDIYTEAMRAQRSAVAPPQDKQRIIVESDLPDYFLKTAQQRASTYYQTKFKLTNQAKSAQHFTSQSRKFEPE